MNRIPGTMCLALAMSVPAMASCEFDTSPIRADAEYELAAAAPVMPGGGLASPPAASGVTTAAPPSTAPVTGNATPPPPVVDTHPDAQVPQGAVVDAATPELDASSDPLVPTCAPSCPTTAVDRCAGVGSYGLHLAFDVTWAPLAAFSAPGHGLATADALLRITHVDPQTGTFTGTGQLCGLVLPALGTGASCETYRLDFDDAMWTHPALPSLEIAGSYVCDANKCQLQLAPTTYVLGTRLDPKLPWPLPGAAPIDELSDDDGDGSPGVSAEIVVQPMAAGSFTCAGGSASAAGAAAPAPMRQGRRLLLALRTELSADLTLDPDCNVEAASGNVRSLELRAAGCAYPAPNWTTADAGTLSCSEGASIGLDQSLPQYHVLAAGERPDAANGGASQGTEIQAAHITPSATCRDVRSAAF